jgi:ferredoxin
MPQVKDIDNKTAGVYNSARFEGVRCMYVVNKDKCTGCGACTDACPTEAIGIEDGKAVIGLACMDCGACPRVCPEGAIRKVAVASAVSSG